MKQGIDTPRFIVGIDLGTTNCAVAFVDTTLGGEVRIFPIPQIVGPGEVESRETLPSFHYEPTTAEQVSMRLPWQSEPPDHGVGVWARDHGAASPGRLVVSAKSWLSHSGVDRNAPLLPWHGLPDVTKLSPGDASARTLAHIREAWDFAHPDHPLDRQEVIITIPASFDEVARGLTVAAARRAKLPRVVLLEEPQAAFYAWIHAHGKRWHNLVKAGQKILVCDIGGGTSDFTLIAVEPDEKAAVRFHRFAVGEHLILGGDNLDLALAHYAENKIGTKLSPRQWSVLVRLCQRAKETLLGPAAPAQFSLSLPFEGARLIGGALQIALSRDEVVALLIDGFLPRIGLNESPARRASGFQEFGLPYAPDPAITRHLAAFLRGHDTRPDVLLFNGGLFESSQLRERLLEVLGKWFPDVEPPVVLQNERLDLAVAIGAAYYGVVRQGKGVRISGGLARSYYIGVNHEGLDRALCLAPAGLEEGRAVELAGQPLELLLKRPVEFPLYVSSLRTTDRAGDLIEIDPLQITALSPIHTVLRSKQEGDSVKVHLHAKLTEIGTLEIWCGEISGTRTWRLEFDVRAATRTDAPLHVVNAEQAGILEDQSFDAARDLIQSTLGPDANGEPDLLVNRLEESFGIKRGDWPPTLLRRLWVELASLESTRRRSPAHEARWLNLMGYCLRPGFGLPADDWRVTQAWRLAEKKVVHDKSELCRAEWWIFWRRIAAGLAPGQQHALAASLIAQVRRGLSERAPHENAEIWRLLASLESLKPDLKIELGNLLISKFAQNQRIAAWALGRFGSRVAIHGNLQAIVPVEIAENWVTRLIDLPSIGNHAEANFAVMQMTRFTGDRYRDGSQQIRERALAWLEKNSAPAHYISLVKNGGDLAEEEENRAFGEALPKGLRLT